MILRISLVFGCGGAAAGGGATAEVPSVGPAEAPLLVVEFGDYQCGPCTAMGRALHELVDREPRRIRFVYRHCPSRAHPIGRLSALVALAAADDGSFWGLHWQLVANGPVQSEEQLWRVVEEAGLDAARLRRVVATGRPAALLEQDLAEADRLGVRGMPTTFVAGRKIEGTVSLGALRRLIEEAARSSRSAQ